MLKPFRTGQPVRQNEFGLPRPTRKVTPRGRRPRTGPQRALRDQYDPYTGHSNDQKAAAKALADRIVGSA
jgi:hypothetical protein